MAEAWIIVVGRLPELDRDVVAPGAGLEVFEVGDLTAAERMLSDASTAPELIVLVQSRPGEFGAADIEALRRAAPLARVWRVLGSWSEGEARSGQPPAGCTSFYWHQWPARWAQELAALREQRTVSWALPVTASAEERTLALAERPLARGTGLIVTCARHAATAGALADVCRQAGYQPLVVGVEQRWHAESAVAVLRDTEAGQLHDRTAISQLRAAAGGAPLVALVSFPRAEDVAAAIDAGASGVVSKPWIAHDLLWEVARAVGGRVSIEGG